MVGLREKHVPLRRCVVCGTQRPKSALVRVVRTPEGHIDANVAPKTPGRGAYVCRSSECLGKAAKGRPLSRSLRQTLPETEAERLRELAHELSEAERDVRP